MVLALNNVAIEKYIKGMTTVNVLTTVKKREQVLDTVERLNPHVVVIGGTLKGGVPFEDVVRRVRKNCPAVQITFLYGDEDENLAWFADMLVSEGVYNFHAGELETYELDALILEANTREDVAKWVLDTEERDRLAARRAPKIREVSVKASDDTREVYRGVGGVEDDAISDSAKSVVAQILKNVRGGGDDKAAVAEPVVVEQQPAPVASVAPVVEVVRETTVVKTLSGYIQVGVAGTVPRMGASCTALAVGAALANKGYSVAVVEYNTHKYPSIHGEVTGSFSLYNMLDEYEDRAKEIVGGYTIRGIDIYYTGASMRANSRNLGEIKGKAYDFIVVDCGVFGEEGFDYGEFYRSNLKLIVAGAKPHENDLTEIFGGEHIEVSEDIRFVLSFATHKQLVGFQKAVGNKVYDAGYCPNPFEPPVEVDDIIKEYVKNINDTKVRKRSVGKWVK